MNIKIIALAVAAVAATSSVASANSYFKTGDVLQTSDVLDIGLVRAEGPGVVEIYNYHTGIQGALLGSEQVNAGANSDVRVDTGLPATSDVLAVLTVNGQIVATKQFVIKAN